MISAHNGVSKKLLRWARCAHYVINKLRIIWMTFCYFSHRFSFL